MKPARSLRSQIVGLFLGGIAVAAVLGAVVFYVGGTRVLEGWLLTSNKLLARAIRRHLEHALSKGTAASHQLAMDLEQARGDPVRRSQMLYSFLEFGDLFQNAYVFSADARLTQFVYRPGLRTHLARHGESYRTYPAPFPANADQAFRDGTSRFTAVYYTRSGRAQLSYLVPLRGPDGKPAELVSLAVYALSDQVNAFIRDLAPEGGGYIAVLDSTGRAVAVSGQAPKELVAGTAGARPAGAPEGDEVLSHYSAGGRDDLIITGKLAEAGLTVWVGLPRAVVYAPLSELRLPAAMALLGMLVLGVMAAVQLSRGILVPLEGLVGGIRRVGEGVLSHRIPEGRDDELGEAARAFNQMASRLQRDQLIEDVWRRTPDRDA